MAILDPRQQQEEEQNQTNTQISGGVSSASDSGNTSGGSSHQQTGNVLDANQLSAQNTGNDWSSLLPTKTIDQGYTAEGAAKNDFYTKAGSAPTWDASVFDNAIKTGNTAQAKTALNQSYSGPSQMDTGWMNNLANLGNFSNWSDPSYLASQERQRNPNLTQGEAWLDGLLASRDANFKRQLNEQQSRLNALYSLADQDLSASKTKASELQQGYTDYQSRAKSYVNDWQNNINGSVQNQYQNALTQYNNSATYHPGLSSAYGQWRDDYAQSFRNAGFNPDNLWAAGAGVAPTLENVKTADQVRQLQNIKALFGEATPLTNNDPVSVQSWSPVSWSINQPTYDALKSYWNRDRGMGATTGEIYTAGRNLGYTGDYELGGFNNWLDQHPEIKNQSQQTLYPSRPSITNGYDASLRNAYNAGALTINPDSAYSLIHGEPSNGPTWRANQEALEAITNWLNSPYNWEGNVRGGGVTPQQFFDYGRSQGYSGDYWAGGFGNWMDEDKAGYRRMNFGDWMAGRAR